VEKPPKNSRSDKTFPDLNSEVRLYLLPHSFAAYILIADANSQPESLTMAPGGALIVGSASAFGSKVRKRRGVFH
jgi:hypothetical protein